MTELEKCNNGECYNCHDKVFGGVIVLPGVTIGNGCVIGAGSVVTKDIPDNSLAVGNPCRVIREINKEGV